ncbi:hypothetical protein [Nostoc sp. CHAB 5715]|uniref:hypothetical protein n=1 Tax=Nostoc sp. CHAB 5715 TaxID=2780400 RepID=UPI001E29AF54|nr:hypothetical protein [Nostoc sp. CHAB 5715]MCC5620577.1 hypothetical protein [Nostoc sp. CHAB 5715]
MTVPSSRETMHGKKNMGVQQVLLHPDNETLAILEYLCQQSGKLYIAVPIQMRYNIISQGVGARASSYVST